MSWVVIVEQLIADKPLNVGFFFLRHTKVQDDLQLLLDLLFGKSSAFQQNLAQGQNLTFGKLLNLLCDQTVAIFLFVVLDFSYDAFFSTLFRKKIPDTVYVSLNGADIYMVLLCGLLLIDELTRKKILIKFQHTGHF